MKKILYCSIIIFIFSLLFTPVCRAEIEPPTQTSVISSGVQDFARQLGYTSATSLPDLIANIIRILLGLLGFVFFILVIYGGYLYMMSSGEPDKTKKAKNIMTYAAIGIVIIFLAYSISSFVINSLQKSQEEDLGETGGSPP